MAKTYFIKRKIEKTKPKEDLELIAKAVEINKQFKEQGLPAEFKVKEILEASIGQKVHQYISFQEDKNTTEILDL